MIPPQVHFHHVFMFPFARFDCRFLPVIAKPIFTKVRGGSATSTPKVSKRRWQSKEKCSVVSTFFNPAKCYGEFIKDVTRQLNFIGPQVRKFREAKGWTQDNLAVKVQLFGWDTSRLSVTRLENQERRVPDVELFVFASVLGVSTDDLFPPNLRKKIKTLWPQYRVKLSRGQLPPKQ